MTTTHSVELFDDPAAVLAVTEDLLAADPVVSSVVASVTQHAARTFAPGSARPEHPMWWAVVRDARDAVVALSMRTMPQPPHTVWVPALPDDAARLLARTVLDHTAEAGEPPLTSANGPMPAVSAFMAEVLRATGGTVHEGRPDRLWEATRVSGPDPGPSGRARRATTDDVDLVTARFDVFHAEADAQAGRTPDESDPVRVEGARRLVDEGGVWLWDVDGEVVHLTGARPPSFGVVRIGPVYTPPEHRGHGYARALVAAVAQQVLDDGHRACLYTDRDNPVSNHVYATIGFEPLLDQVNLVVDHAAGAGTTHKKEH